jgi:proteasome lid subunit RPN8/RPN11
MEHRPAIAATFAGAWAVATALAIVGLLLTCARVANGPMVPRRDTAALSRVEFDSIPWDRTMRLFAAMSPNEIAVCYTGEVQDTTLDSGPIRYLHLEFMHPAIVDSSDNFHVWFSHGGEVAACRHPIAIGHSHPNSVGPCTHSEPDARLLFLNPRLYASIVICPDGELEVLWQDGRRTEARWR